METTSDTRKEILIDLLGEEKSAALLDELRKFLESKPLPEQAKIKETAKKMLLGDEAAADEFENLLSAGNSNVQPQPVLLGVGFILVGIGCMLLA